MKTPRRTPVLKGFAQLALAASLALALSACNQSGAADEKTAEVAGQPVEVVQAKLGAMDVDYLGTANLESDRAAMVMSEIGGEITQIMVEEGDRVKAGQVLAKVEDNRARLMLQQQQAMNERLALDVNRNEQLATRQLVSRDLLDQTRFQQATQRAAVSLARLDLSKTEIRAPFDGVITRRHIKPGQWLSLRQAAFEIADFNLLKARVNVPEKNAHLIHAGMPVTVTTELKGAQTLQAQVERVSPVVDRTTGTVSVTLTVPNTNWQLRPGQFVRTAIRYGRVENAVLVPRAAVIEDEGESVVFVVNNKTVTRNALTLGWEREGVVQVLSGLANDATVVLSGQAGLRNGSKVELLAAN